MSEADEKRLAKLRAHDAACLRDLPPPEGHERNTTFLLRLLDAAREENARLERERNSARAERDELEQARGDWTGRKCTTCKGCGEVAGEVCDLSCGACGGTGDEWLSWKARATRAESALAEARERVGEPFQARVQPWMMTCFGAQISADRTERNHRFLEEALELVQAIGCAKGEAHQLVDYVYGRPIGEPRQEVGGVMVTLAALCLANALDMHECGETELARIWTKVEQIRAKQAAKPRNSPLPAALTPPSPDRSET